MRFLYAFNGGELAPVCGADGEPLMLDASIMSDERVAGWAYTGSMVGITCVDTWDKTVCATFRSFVYEDLQPEGAR